MLQEVEQQASVLNAGIELHVLFFFNSAWEAQYKSHVYLVDYRLPLAAG